MLLWSGPVDHIDLTIRVDLNRDLNLNFLT